MKPASRPMVSVRKWSRCIVRSPTLPLSPLRPQGRRGAPPPTARPPNLVTSSIRRPSSVGRRALLSKENRPPEDRAAGENRCAGEATSVRGPHPPVTLLEAGGERALHQLLGVLLGDVLDVRDLAHDEVLGALVHLLLAEGETLLEAHQAQVLEHLGDLGQPPSLHLV